MACARAPASLLLIQELLPGPGSNKFRRLFKGSVNNRSGRQDSTSQSEDPLNWPVFRMANYPAITTFTLADGFPGRPFFSYDYNSGAYSIDCQSSFPIVFPALVQ